jgi:hypothetical protein
MASIKLHHFETTAHHSCLVACAIFIIVVVISECEANGQTAQLDVTGLKDRAFPSFQEKFTNFSHKALQKDTLLNLFLDNVHLGSGARRLTSNGQGKFVSKESSDNSFSFR